MASQPSSSHLDASNSENSATHPILPSPPDPQAGCSAGNVLAGESEEKPVVVNNYQNFDHMENPEKYRRYEADYSRRIMAKYFSSTNIFGGEIFKHTTIVEGRTIRSSRWHATRSFMDPTQALEDEDISSSIPTEETLTNLSSKKSG